MKKSKCCNSDVEIKTTYSQDFPKPEYYCKKCGKPCDTIDQPEPNEEKVIPESVKKCLNCKYYNGWTDYEGFPTIGCAKVNEKEGIKWVRPLEDCSCYESDSTPAQPEKEWKEELSKCFWEGDCPTAFHRIENLIETLLQSRDRDWETKMERIKGELEMHGVKDIGYLNYLLKSTK